MRAYSLFCRNYIRIIRYLGALIIVLLLLLAALAFSIVNYRSNLDAAIDGLSGAVGAVENALETARDAWDKNASLEAALASIKAVNQKLKVNGATFTATVTAYTPYAESTGKKPGHPQFGITYSGWQAGFGVCAADPTYWPMGTVLYIDGYGFCVVSDTGGAIKGKNRFDVFIYFPNDEKRSVELARAWGVRKVKVVVVGVPD